MSIVAIALAGLLAVAACGKLRDRDRAGTMLGEFGVPERWSRLAMVALVAAELTVAALLVAAPRAGAVATVVLLLVFSGAMARLLRAGRTASCHCFGDLGSTSVGPTALLRNGALLAVALLVVWAPAGFAAGALVGAAAVVMGWRGRVRRPPREVAGTRLGDGRVVALLFSSPGCGPCVALRAGLAGWQSAVGKDIALVVVEDRAVAAAFGVLVTPGAVIVGADGRPVGAPALGAPAIEAALQRFATGRPDAVWESITTEAFGTTFSIESDDPSALDAARHVLPPDSTITDAAPGARWSLLGAGLPGAALYRDGACIGRHAALERIVEALAAAIRLHVAERAPEHVFIHAGVVGLGGRAIVVPGASFSGKSTLVAALLHAGATYLSDEYAVLDAEGLVHPYVKPIALRPAGTHASVDHDVSEFTALAPQRGPLPLGVVLQAPFVAGARWDPRQGTPGEAALALLANCVGVRADPARALAVIRRATAGAVFLDGPRDEADATALGLCDRLEMTARA